MAAEGIEFRATAGFVTNQAGDTHSLGEAYPTSRGGKTFGWDTNRTAQSRDRTAGLNGLDGIVYVANGGSTGYFRYDIAAGTYTLRLALGDAAGAQAHKVNVRDGVGGTILATISGSTGTAEWLDASGTLRTTYVLWNSSNASITITLTGTSLVLELGDPTGSAVTCISRMVLESAGDTTAPTLTSPTGTSTGSTTATAGATTDEGNGTLYAVVTTSATAPTKAQVKAGQNAAGSAANWSGSVAVSSTGAKTLNATGLTASTTYYAHLMHEDAATNQANVVSSTSFTTSAGASGSKGRYFYQFGSPQC